MLFRFQSCAQITYESYQSDKGIYNNNDFWCHIRHVLLVLMYICMLDHNPQVNRTIQEVVCIPKIPYSVQLYQTKLYFISR